MGKYSIKELEQLSGIKAHTIRIWEKRHKVISPARTNTNIRYYSDDDLKKIISISLLNNHGIKISRIVQLSGSELSSMVVDLTNENTDDKQVYIDQLVLAMIDLLEDVFERTVKKLILQFGFEKVILEIIYPFLEKVGVLWHTGVINPAQEHFISQLIRQKIIVAIDSLPAAEPKAARIILFLPENELHEIGLLFYHYLTKKAGFKTYYLGQTVPYSDVKQICELYQPQFVISSITTFLSGGPVKAFFEDLSRAFPASHILVAGRAFPRLQLPTLPNLSGFNSAVELKAALKIS
jgi:MerR family transcriptional regulator, light-induced transcriptional regulator